MYDELGVHLLIKHKGSEPPCTICARKAEMNWLLRVPIVYMIGIHTGIINFVIHTFQAC